MLTKVLYKYHKNDNLELDPTLFQQMIEEADSRLKVFLSNDKSINS